MEKFTGKVWVLGDDIDTDIIIPTEYLALKTIDDMKQYGFSPLRPELAGQIQKGDIITSINNMEVRSIESLQEKANSYKKGTQVEIILQRSDSGTYKEKKVKVTLQGSSSLNGLSSGKSSNNDSQSGNSGNNSQNGNNGQNGSNGNSGQNGSNGNIGNNGNNSQNGNNGNNGNSGSDSGSGNDWFGFGDLFGN